MLKKNAHFDSNDYLKEEDENHRCKEVSLNPSQQRSNMLRASWAASTDVRLFILNLN